MEVKMTIKEESPESDGIEFDLNNLPFIQKPLVLVLDNEIATFNSVPAMAHSIGYNATACSGSEAGQSLIKRYWSEYDIVMISVDMNGLGLLEILAKELKNKMPIVIMMASTENKDDVFRATYLGASDYVLKPVTEDFVRGMWKHVVRKKKDSSSSREAAKVVWTDTLHAQFVDAVKQIGFERATPMKIFRVMQRLMGCDRLSRQSIASHLKTYKLKIRKQAKEVENARNGLSDLSVNRSERGL